MSKGMIVALGFLLPFLLTNYYSQVDQEKKKKTTREPESVGPIFILKFKTPEFGGQAPAAQTWKVFIQQW